MRKIILEDYRLLSPFNDRARDLRIQNKPLWLLQRDVLAPYTDKEQTLLEGQEPPDTEDECIMYRDNLFFDRPFIEAFISTARKFGKPVQAAFSMDDGAFREHALPLSTSYVKEGKLYLAELWYFPSGPRDETEPLVIDLQSKEVGYYHVPTYMATEKGDLTFQVPLRSLLAIDSWVHIFLADVVFGLFARGIRFERLSEHNPFFKIRVLIKALYEGKQILSSSELVSIGRNCVIDPSAVIQGPTTIGDNVTIGAGTVIDNCIIGDNVNISQGSQLMLSVVGDGAFLPFRSALFMTTFMDNSMVAQNTCLQMCVVGRNTFIGAGTTFTDFNLIPQPLRALDGNNDLDYANRDVLGGCVGHNCRLGAGMIVMPARTIESDVILVASRERRVVEKNITYEQSDHHQLRSAHLHMRLYPRQGEMVEDTW